MGKGFVKKNLERKAGEEEREIRDLLREMICGGAGRRRLV